MTDHIRIPCTLAGFESEGGGNEIVVTPDIARQIVAMGRACPPDCLCPPCSDARLARVMASKEEPADPCPCPPTSSGLPYAHRHDCPRVTTATPEYPPDTDYRERLRLAEARIAQLMHDPKADARAIIEEWKAKAERAWSDLDQAKEDCAEKRADVAELVGLLREALSQLDLTDRGTASNPNGIRTRGRAALAKHEGKA